MEVMGLQPGLVEDEQTDHHCECPQNMPDIASIHGFPCANSTQNHSSTEPLEDQGKS